MFENFKFAFGCVTPLVLLMALGFLLRRSGMLTQAFFTEGNRLVFRILIPCSVFISMYNCQSLRELNGPFILLVGGLITAEFLIGWVTVPFFIKDPYSRGSAHQCCYRNNLPVIGSALAASLAGAEGMARLAGCMLLAVPLPNIFAVIALSTFPNRGGKKKSPAQVAISVIKNPIVLSTILGVSFLLIRELMPLNAAGQPVFTIKNNLAFVYDVISKLAAANTPISLIVLGGMVDFSAMGGRLSDLLYGIITKLVLCPVFGVGVTLALSRAGLLTCGAPEFAAVLACFGSSIAIASAPMAMEMGGDAELARQYTLWTNSLLIISLPIEIVIMRTIGLI